MTGSVEQEDLSPRAGRAGGPGSAALLEGGGSSGAVTARDGEPVTVGKWKTGPDREDERGAPRRRVEWFVAPRAHPHRELPETAVLAAFLESVSLEAAEPRTLTPAQASRTRWQFLGPGNFSGRVNAIAVDPTNTERLYVCTSSGGLWRTVDGGRSWADIGGSLGTNFTGAVAVQPTNGDVVYVGTGDMDIGLPGAGLFKSVDGGGTFSLTGLTSVAWVSRVLVHPTVPSTVYAATNTGLHRTLDGGATWTRLLSGVITDLAMPTGDPQTLWAARSFDSLANSGVLRSTDAGATWTVQSGKPSVPFGRVRMALCTGTPSVVYASFDVAGAVQIWKTSNSGTSWTNLPDPPDAGWGQLWYNHYVAVRPDNPDVVYSGQGTIFRSVNGGVGGGVGAGKAWQEIHDAGASGFTTIHVDHHCLTFDPVNPQVVYAGCDGGIYRSRFGGRFWEYIGAAIPCSEFYAVGSGTQEWHRVGGGTQDNGTWHTDGSVGRWENILGGDGFYYVVDPTDPNTIYAEAQYLWLARSLDKGRTFAYKGGGGIHEADPKPWKGIIELDESSPTTLYVGSDRLYRSDNRMDSWTRLPCGDDLVLISNRKGSGGSVGVEPTSTAAAVLGLAGSVAGTDDAAGNPQSWARMASTRRGPFPLAHGSTLALRVDGGGVQTVTFDAASFGNIAAATAAEVARAISSQTTGLDVGTSAGTTFSAIRVARSNRNVIYAAAGPQLWRSVDGGATWRSLARTPLPNRWITDIDVSGGNSDDVWVSVSGFGTAHAFRSTDGGASWVERSAGLPDTPANAVVVDPRRSTRVWLATDLGIYATTDAGLSWLRYSEGLPRVVVTDLRLHRNTGLLRAGSYGRGVWEIQATDPTITITRSRTASNGVADRAEFRRTADALALTLDLTATQDLLDLGLRYDAVFQVVDGRTNQVVRQVTTQNAAFSASRSFWISRGNNWGPTPGHFTTPERWGLGTGLFFFRGIVTVRDTNTFSVSQPRWFRVV